MGLQRIHDSRQKRGRRSTHHAAKRRQHVVQGSPRNEFHAELPNHSSSRTLLQNLLLQMQQNHGNVHVQSHVAASIAGDNVAIGSASSMDSPIAASPESSEVQLSERVSRAMGRGDRLDSAVRHRLEAGLGGDLSDARIHVDAEADTLANAFDARAFTTGADIFFRSGMYAPDTVEGFHLLAHEAAHIVQQGLNPPFDMQGSLGPLTVSHPSDRSEQEAKLAAKKITTGQTALINTSPKVSISRSDEEDSLIGTIWNTVTNSAISGGAGLLQESGNYARAGKALLPSFEKAGLSPRVGQSLSNMGSRTLGQTPSEGAKLFGTTTLGRVLGPLGLASSIMNISDTITDPGTFGLDDLADTGANIVGGFSSLVATLEGAGALASLAGGSSTLAGAGTAGSAVAGGLTSTGTALSGAAAAAAPAAAVAGAAAGGYAVGTAIDQGFGWLMDATGMSERWDEEAGITRERGGEGGDYTLSGLGSGWLTNLDRDRVERLRARGELNEDTPAYQQTLGWRLAQVLPSWLQ